MIKQLEIFRWHLIRSVVAILGCTVVAFMVAPWIFEHVIFAPARADFPTFRTLCRLGGWLNTPGLCVEDISFRVQSRLMTGQFSMHILASFVTGFVLAFPYVVWEMWRFVKPALRSHEARDSRGAVTSISVLFLCGLLFGFFVLAPLMISFLANYRISDVIVNEFDITSYVGTLVGVVLATAILFQLPVVIYFLTVAGVVTPTGLKKYRKQAIIGILVTGAIITPSSDPLSQALIAIPLYVLYEGSIGISARVLRKRTEANMKVATTGLSAGV